MSNPYASNMPSPTSNPMKPAEKKSGGKNCLIIAIVVIVVLLLICGACGGGFYWLMNIGFTQLQEAVITNYSDHEIVQDKLGGIDEAKFSWQGTQDEAATNPRQDGQSVMVFDVKGPKGSGKIKAIQMGQTVGNAVLVVDGEEFELD